MKIVHIFFTIEVGGSETMMIDIMNRQAVTQEVSLVVINRENNPELLKAIDPSIALHVIGRKYRSHNPLPIIRLNRLLWKLRPDVIHLHNRRIMPGLLLKIPHCRYFFTAHTITEILQINRFDRIFAISEYVRNDLVRRYGTARPIEVVYNGIDTKDIITKEELFGNSNTFRIVEIGRLTHWQKGQDILLKALAILQEKAPQLDIHIDFIGSGPSLDFLQKMAKDLRIEKIVSFVGNQNRKEIYHNLHRYDLLVQPSRQEGFGLTIAEAMAAQVPVLTTNIDGPMEVIDYGKYGTSFETNNAEDCARKIEIIFSHYDEAKKTAQQARNYVVENFDIARTVEKYLLSYRL